MRRIDRKRGQHRENVAEEVILEPALLGFGDVRSIDQNDVLLAQILAQRAPARLLIGSETADCLADAGQLLDGSEPVRAPFNDAFAHLVLETGNAHHEEFIEVVGRDRQKAQALEHRMAFVLRFLQHAPVEVEPGEFPIDESLRAGGKLRQRNGDRCRNGSAAPKFHRGGFFGQNKSFTAVSHDTVRGYQGN